MTEQQIAELVERVRAAEAKAAAAEAALQRSRTRTPGRELTIQERLEKSQFFSAGYLLAGGIEGSDLTATLQALTLIQDRQAGKTSLLSGGNIRQASNRACQVVSGYLARKEDGGEAIENWGALIAAAKVIRDAGTGDGEVPAEIQEAAFTAHQEQPEQEQPEQPEQEQPEQPEQPAPKKKAGKK